MENIIYCDEGVVIGQYGFVNVHWAFDPFGNEHILVFDIISNDEENIHFKAIVWSDYFYQLFRELVKHKPDEIIQKYYKGLNKKVIKEILYQVAAPIEYYY